MAYFGKTFVMEKQENFEEFLSALGLTKERVSAFLEDKPTQTLVKNGDNKYTLTLNNVSVTFQPGVEFDEDVRGYQAKTTFVVDGETFTQTQNFTDGNSIVIKRLFSDNKLVVTSTFSQWDGVATRYYSSRA